MDNVLSKKVIIKIDKENFNVYRFLKSLGKDRKRFVIKALANLFPNAVEGITITDKGNYNLSQIRCVSEVLNEMAADQDDKIDNDYELAMSFNTGQYSSDREAYIFALLTCLYQRNNLSTVIIKAVNECYKGFFGLENLVQFDEWSGDPDLIRDNPRKRNIKPTPEPIAEEKNVIDLINNASVSVLLKVGKRIGCTDSAVKYYHNKKHSKFYKNKEALRHAIRREASLNAFDRRNVIKEMLMEHYENQ